MSAEQVLTFGLAAFVLIVIPGPSVVFVIGRALAYGQGVAMASVVGNPAGLLLVMQLFVLGLVAVLLGFASDAVWAAGASRLREWFNGSPRRGRAITTTGGLSMIGLGVAIALTGRPE